MLWQTKHCVAMIDIPYCSGDICNSISLQRNVQDSKDSQIDADQIAIRYESVGSISYRHRSEGICYLSLSRCSALHYELWISSLWEAIRHGNTLDTLRQRQNGKRFADDIAKCIFVNENFCISNNISLKYIPYGLIDNI